ncbi:MAG: glycosyltransferase family 4 protein [Thermoplasmata archaeon]|jgi:glycosyltransferase involved in cell wall biosynthesis
MRVLLAGAALQERWVGGEPEVARLLGIGLRREGHEVIRVAQAREGAALASMALVPLDYDPVSEKRYFQVLRETRPDVVLAFYDYDTSLVRSCRRAGLPVIVCAHIFWPTCPIGVMYIDGQGTCDGAGFAKCLRHTMVSVPDSRLPIPFRELPFPAAMQVYLKFLTRAKNLRTANAIVVPSESMRDLLQTQGLGGIQVIPNAVDANQFKPRAESSGIRRVLFPAGSTSERKGFSHFVRLAQKLKRTFPTVEFTATNYVGDESITRSSYLSRADYVRLLQDSTIVVVPPLWPEPFGMVALEAMAAGRPVVAYRSGALPEIVVDGESGIIADVGDVRTLTDGVQTLLEDESMCDSMGRAGRRRAENEFNLEQMTQRYLSLIGSVTNSTRSSE